MDRSNAVRTIENENARPVTKQRYFEDLNIGTTVTSPEITVNENDIIEFAKRYDPEWFHTDPEKAKESIFGALIASGVHTFALFRRLDHEMNHDVAAICGLEWTSVRFPKPVYANDRLVASSAVTDKRLSKSKPDRGVCHLQVENDKSGRRRRNDRQRQTARQLSPHR